MTEILLALGSNYEQKRNMRKAKMLLREAFGDSLRFTEDMWTEPIGIDSDRFLNCLGTAKTTLSQAELTDLLKLTERICGDTAELRRRNIIVMDIDLLRFGQTKLHAADWQRAYISRLIKSFDI